MDKIKQKEKEDCNISAYKIPVRRKVISCRLGSGFDVIVTIPGDGMVGGCDISV
jgi:hypothetical protein